MNRILEFGRESWKKYPLTIIAYTIAAAFVAINFATIDDYGLTFDEPDVMSRGRQTILMVRDIANFRGDNQFAAIESYHPTFYATCNFLFSRFLMEWFGVGRVAAYHALNLIVATLGLIALFHLGSALFSDIVGLWAVIFLALYPRFISHSHYNPKDVPVMVFASITVLCVFYGIEKGKRILVVVGALMFAVATTSKLDGIFLLPILAMWWIFRKFDHSERPGVIRNSIALFLYSSFVFTVLLWPSLWADPSYLSKGVLHFAGNFNRFNISYLGHQYANNDAPWHYYIVHLAATSPTTFLVAILAAAIPIRTSSYKHNSRIALVGAWLVLPLLSRMFPGTAKYDGMRHVFFVMPALALLGGIGIEKLYRQIGGRLQSLAGKSIVVILVLCQLLWQSVEIHPFQGSYLNEVVRLLVPPSKLGHCFDFYSWGAPLKQAVDWLDVNAPVDAVILVPNHLPSLAPYPIRPDLQLRNDGPADFEILMNWRQDLISQTSGSRLFSVDLYGTSLLSIYSTDTAKKRNTFRNESNEFLNTWPQ